MSHSFAQQLSLTCPQCSQSFDADIWLTVDTDANPHLLALLQQGSIHVVSCLQCRHQGSVDAPLLIYRANENPALVFSPAQSTNQEEDQQQASDLLYQLQSTLTNAWDETWLEDLIVVPRQALSTYLSEKSEVSPDELQRPFVEPPTTLNPQEPLRNLPLHEATTELLQVQDETSFKEVIKRNPILLTDESDRNIVAMITRLETLDLKNKDEILSKLNRLRQRLQKARKWGIDEVIWSNSILAMLYMWVDDDQEKLAIIDSFTRRIREELKQRTTLKELQELTVAEPSFKASLEEMELDFDRIRSMVVLASLGALISADSVDNVRRIINETPELLNDDVQIMLDHLIDDGDPASVAQYVRVKELLQGIQQVGVEAATQDELVLEQEQSLVDKLAEETSFTNDIDERTTEGVTSAIIESLIDKPDVVNTIGEEDDLAAAFFAVVDMVFGQASATDLLLTINNHPVMLTKPFDDRLTVGIEVITAGHQLPDDLPREALPEIA
jgi:hypothetical protein